MVDNEVRDHGVERAVDERQLGEDREAYIGGRHGGRRDFDHARLRVDGGHPRVTSHGGARDAARTGADVQHGAAGMTSAASMHTG